ncbi:RRM 1 domain containing protein, partial [Asbolus verrucosus]
MYVQVAESEDKEPIKLLTEEDGTLLLTTVLKQFPQCSGLIYKNPSTKALRWAQLSKDKLHPPPDVGWDSEIFYCVFAAATMTKMTLEKYFQSFGEVSAVTIKSDSKTGQSTGFVTIKFDSDGLKEKLMEQIHTIDEQVCFVKIDNFQSPK